MCQPYMQQTVYDNATCIVFQKITAEKTDSVVTMTLTDRQWPRIEIGQAQFLSVPEDIWVDASGDGLLLRGSFEDDVVYETVVEEISIYLETGNENDIQAWFIEQTGQEMRNGFDMLSGRYSVCQPGGVYRYQIRAASGPDPRFEPSDFVTFPEDMGLVTVFNMNDVGEAEVVRENKKPVVSFLSEGGRYRIIAYPEYGLEDVYYIHTKQGPVRYTDIPSGDYIFFDIQKVTVETVEESFIVRLTRHHIVPYTQIASGYALITVIDDESSDKGTYVAAVLSGDGGTLSKHFLSESSALPEVGGVYKYDMDISNGRLLLHETETEIGGYVTVDYQVGADKMGSNFVTSDTVAFIEWEPGSWNCYAGIGNIPSVIIDLSKTTADLGDSPLFNYQVDAIVIPYDAILYEYEPGPVIGNYMYVYEDIALAMIDGVRYQMVTGIYVGESDRILTMMFPVENITIKRDTLYTYTYQFEGDGDELEEVAGIEEFNVNANYVEGSGSFADGMFTFTDRTILFVQSGETCERIIGVSHIPSFSVNGTVKVLFDDMGNVEVMILTI